MPENATVATPATQEPGSQSGSPSDVPIEPEQISSAQAKDKAMDEAFQKHLAPELGTAKVAPEPQAPGTPKEAEKSEVQLSDTEAQTLSRLHMTPEMINGWSDQQRSEFLENAAKREADQTSAFKKLQEQNGSPGQQDKDGKQTGELAPQKPQETPDGGFADSAQKVVDEIAGTYGDEIKPLGDLMVKLGQMVDSSNQQTAALQASSSSKDGLIVQLSIQAAISDLVGEYPSLNKAEARKKVEDKFVSDWKSEGSIHRNSDGPLLDRIRLAMTDAAKAEFGTTTETAAQVALANTNKKQLTNQPDASDGKARQQPRTQEDLYDIEYERHLT